jgi:hypothetical protein
MRDTLTHGDPKLQVDPTCRRCLSTDKRLYTKPRWVELARVEFEGKEGPSTPNKKWLEIQPSQPIYTRQAG